MNRFDLFTLFFGILLIAGTAGAADQNPDMSMARIIAQCVVGLFAVVVSSLSIIENSK